MTGISNRPGAWEWSGLAAALLICIALPVYYFAGPAGQDVATTGPQAAFVGSAQCED